MFSLLLPDKVPQVVGTTLSFMMICLTTYLMVLLEVYNPTDVNKDNQTLSNLSEIVQLKMTELGENPDSSAQLWMWWLWLSATHAYELHT
jgi:hypothetical protein